MTLSHSWQCFKCGEEHEEHFDACWKCGSYAIGTVDPAFRAAKPWDADDEPYDSSAEELQLPKLELPTVSYYCFPVLGLLLVHLRISSVMNDLAFQPSVLEIVVTVFYFLLVVVPGIAVLLPALFGMFARWVRTGESSSVRELFWMMSILKLPQHIQRSQSSFVPVYYASFVLMAAAPAIYLWRLAP